MVCALDEVEGVKKAEAGSAEKKATVELTDEKVTIEQLCRAFECKRL